MLSAIPPGTYVSTSGENCANGLSAGTERRLPPPVVFFGVGMRTMTGILVTMLGGSTELGTVMLATERSAHMHTWQF